MCTVNAPNPDFTAPSGGCIGNGREAGKTALLDDPVTKAKVAASSVGPFKKIEKRI